MSSSSLKEDGRLSAPRLAGDNRRDAAAGAVDETSSGPDDRDVLFADGGAAQSMTHPGTLRFYALCDARRDDWRRAPAGRHRRRICGEVVDAVSAGGGALRDRRGGILSRADALKKVRDRFKSMERPRVRPGGGFGPEDVVFARGGRNRLYPGNDRWTALLDGHVLAYFRDVLDERNAVVRRLERNRKGPRRPPYKIEIVDEIIRVVHGRGGKFRDANLRELTHEEAAERTHLRFNDVKKQLARGTKTWSSLRAAAATSSAGGDASNERDLRTFKRKEMFVRRNNSHAKKNNNHGSDGDESLQSAALGSDGCGGGSDGEEDSEGDLSVHAPKRTDKGQQDRDRAERLKRRNEGRLKRKGSGATPPSKPPPDETTKKSRGEKGQARKRKRGGQRDGEGTDRDPSPDRPLSEYERYRLEKIRRNLSKLAELGLA